ncbi:hypothetical protein SAMN05216511_0035 [Streptomyces sp. KS_16]|nr:hypothetical protein BX261_7215 [Streptomyces sp. 2321.6]SDQ62309.1 hypothetical protein SAMN05216511_0035 [Streptomyces sp. KS_16]SEE18515.1 hypothetical protein SAMN05428940_7240 [Streptomyces sp. 2133.1]SNC74252.1 hypothetical protein SAMN06272741_7140 [Streptomyces sp. 2114.4]
MSDIDDRLLALVDSVVASEEERLPLLTLGEAARRSSCCNCSALALAMERTQPGTWPGIWPDGSRPSDSAIDGSLRSRGD